jgi:hypothetical protein
MMLMVWGRNHTQRELCNSWRKPICTCFLSFYYFILSFLHFLTCVYIIWVTSLCLFSITDLTLLCFSQLPRSWTKCASAMEHTKDKPNRYLAGKQYTSSYLWGNSGCGEHTLYHKVVHPLERTVFFTAEDIGNTSKESKHLSLGVWKLEGFEQMEMVGGPSW